jgi:anti-anti-sigma factor
LKKSEAYKQYETQLSKYVNSSGKEVQPMKISVRNFVEYQIFDLEGPISVDDAESIEAFIYENISRESSKTVINLKNIIQINSQTLGSFVRIQRTIKEKGITLAIICTNPDLSKLFRITGTAHFFTFYKNEDEIK